MIGLLVLLFLLLAKSSDAGISTAVWTSGSSSLVSTVYGQYRLINFTSKPNDNSYGDPVWELGGYLGSYTAPFSSATLTFEMRIYLSSTPCYCSVHASYISSIGVSTSTLYTVPDHTVATILDPMFINTSCGCFKFGIDSIATKKGRRYYFHLFDSYTNIPSIPSSIDRIEITANLMEYSTS